MAAVAGAAVTLVALAMLAGGARAGSEEGSCPIAAVGSGVELGASFADGEPQRTVTYGRGVLIRGRVADAQGTGVAGLPVCVEERLSLPGSSFRLDGVATTDVDGDWFYKLHSGASRAIRVVHRSRSGQVQANLDLAVRAIAKLRLSRHRTPVGRRVYFNGRVPGPSAGGRVVFIRAAAPGARRKYLVRRARTDAFGRFRAAYAFGPVSARAKFAFWAVVPAQNGYPYLRGRSANHFIRVTL